MTPEEIVEWLLDHGYATEEPWHYEGLYEGLGDGGAYTTRLVHPTLQLRMAVRRLTKGEAGRFTPANLLAVELTKRAIVEEVLKVCS